MIISIFILLICLILSHFCVLFFLIHLSKAIGKDLVILCDLSRLGHAKLDRLLLAVSLSNTHSQD
jgi:hypothetical protein